jgi:hypothetical protein
MGLCGGISASGGKQLMVGQNGSKTVALLVGLTQPGVASVTL